MELELTFYGCLCATAIFAINDVIADSSDFGSQEDEAFDKVEDYACGNMRFTRVDSTPEILKKYKITEDNYNTIADKLTEGLSFGCCGWCV
ncbi:hypothetical protein LCGC14_2209360 [marine sediment metagenome]|uniref:Uncharacterized protein n=1 Tax=marine sediment metagenome TaxID=412755 RepID=A0A0F9G9Z3_9ZZZZ